MSRLERLPATAAALAAAVLLTGCQGVYDLPLPGGAGGGDDAYRVTVEFADVLDLVPQSAVKVNDVTVGAVEKITLRDWTARVVVRLAGDVVLPDNTSARLRQTSLLGEKFVSLEAPATGERVGRLADGDLIPLARSGRNPELEEVLSALSLLLNGGGVAQLQTITRELNAAMTGREGDLRSVISQLDTLVSGLHESQGEIVRALDAVDRLAATLAAQKHDVATALDQVPGGLEVLSDQREQLTAMLTALSDLGTVATRVISASQEDAVANLAALDPILTQLDAAGAALPNSLELLATYPFPDSAVDAVKGDYTNLSVHMQADLMALQGLLPPPPAPVPHAPPPVPVLPLPPVVGPLLPPEICALVPGQPVPAACGPLDLSLLPGILATCPDMQLAVGDLVPDGCLPVTPEPDATTGGGTGYVVDPAASDPLAGLLLAGLAR